MVLKPHARARTQGVFENDVKMYGTQTRSDKKEPGGKFENDVKMYGTQTTAKCSRSRQGFENDVKMYGTQTEGTRLQGHA